MAWRKSLHRIYSKCVATIRTNRDDVRARIAKASINVENLVDLRIVRSNMSSNVPRRATSVKTISTEYSEAFFPPSFASSLSSWNSCETSSAALIRHLFCSDAYIHLASSYAICWILARRCEWFISSGIVCSTSGAGFNSSAKLEGGT